MPSLHALPTAAVIGAGLAGAACADGLRQAGFDVTVFEKSRGAGGRMSTRRVHWEDARGREQPTEFDHGAQYFEARQPRFRAMLNRAEAAGVVARWRPRLHSALPGRLPQQRYVALPQMPALARHLLGETPVHVHHTVQRLQRVRAGGRGERGGWQLVTAEAGLQGPFDTVMLAMPPAQAAVLLAGHHDEWADTLQAQRMLPCWTLLAVTDEVDWPWDAAEPVEGPLAWVFRNDRRPGRDAPAGTASWVAHATPAWSAAQLEAAPADVEERLSEALAALLPRGCCPRWYHQAVHRWRYAAPAGPRPDARDCWWDGELGLGVCGDALAGGDVEAAWRSGDELADTVAVWQEQQATLETAAG